jgi:RNA polymerase sigma-70 factor (ECF subfamily)
MNVVSENVRERIRAGDLRGAGSSLVVAYAADVLATCVAMVRDRAAAEDLVQEVFADALRGLSTFRGDSSPRTWLLSIARNRCIDYLRAKKRDPWGGVVDESQADPDAHADRGAFGVEWFAERAELPRALEALAEIDRALIVLRFKNGLEYDELAAAFGLREGTVRMRVSRALARMREVLVPTHATEGAAAPQAVRSRAVVAPSAPPLAAPIAPAAVPARAPAPGGAPAPAAGFGAPPQAPPPPPSWWERVKAWAFGASPHTALTAPVPFRPLAPLGLALAAQEPMEITEPLAARLGTLVEQLPG